MGVEWELMEHNFLLFFIIYSDIHSFIKLFGEQYRPNLSVQQQLNLRDLRITEMYSHFLLAQRGCMVILGFGISRSRVLEEREHKGFMSG